MTMRPDVLELVALLPVSVSMLCYAACVMGCLIASRRPRTAPVSVRPRVSILKPLAGVDEGLAENLASFARLTYPDYELLFGVASYEDPALAVAKAFAARHPRVDCRVVVTNPAAARNPKVAQLVDLERLATGSILVISDSNVRVSPEYLEPLVAELVDGRVAATSSLVVGTGERTLGAAIENLQLGGTVAPQVLWMSRWARHSVSVGKTMAVRRTSLAAVGGFRAVGDVLAEDYVLGRILSAAGFRITVSQTAVENRNIACSLTRTVERHVRWAKLRRSIAPVGFAFEPLLSPVLSATAACVFWPHVASFGILLAVCVLQTVGAFTCVRTLRGRSLSIYWAPLEVMRSYLSFYCWLRAWMSREVSWRGHRFELQRYSRIVPLSAEDGVAFDEAVHV